MEHIQQTVERQLGALQLADGRILAWAAHGPRTGRPVLFVAGAATGKSMTFASESLGREDVRLITVDRPGMGGSSPDPHRNLHSTARDLVELVQHVSADPVHVVANSQGAAFGLALATTGAVRRLSLVSPADEVAAEPIRSMLPQEYRAVVESVNADRGEAERVLAALGPERMESLVLHNAHEEDRKIFLEPGFRRRFHAALQEGFANGGVGYAMDTVLAMTPWDLEFESIRASVDMWIGEHDLHHSADQGATLAARIHGSVRTVVPGAGGALLWTHGEQLFRDLP